jgi:hypothetical protein
MDNPTNAALWIAGAQAVAVAVVGLATSLIAWKQAQINERQAQTNERKLNLDNYDRRLRVYQQVIIYLSKAVQNKDVSIDSIAALRSATIEVPFLFSTEIEKYVNELVRHGIRLGTAKEEYRVYTQEQPADYDTPLFVRR